MPACRSSAAARNIRPANWKLLTENSIDGYHAMTTHASYFDILMNSTDNSAITMTRCTAERSRQRACGSGICRAVGPAGREAGEAGAKPAKPKSRDPRKPRKPFRQGAGRPDRVEEPQSLHFPEPRRQRHHGPDGQDLLSDGPRLQVINAWALAPNDDNDRMRELPPHITFSSSSARWICFP